LSKRATITPPSANAERPLGEADPNAITNVDT
jgi:hypothetical protein